MRRQLWTLVLLWGCGDPILKNAPKPDPGAVAGVAAAAAAAATLADPRAANARQEQKAKGEPDNRGVEVKETVPSSVLDRLDHTSDAGVDGAASASSAAPAPAASPAARAPAASPAARTSAKAAPVRVPSPAAAATQQAPEPAPSPAP